jgi:hypothetical protein
MYACILALGPWHLALGRWYLVVSGDGQSAAARCSVLGKVKNVPGLGTEYLYNRKRSRDSHKATIDSIAI